ncbi:ribonuclease P protein component [Thiomicrospira sp. R3]|uniref:ribonuclease P protein component n=1 Tax=Thiomicrospira sp. R3 TaxID=3035472 RepID=UPI00259B7E4F|nr:ribonuclease P protein component [Thiomicrospira sp. R3]WFE69631.1 ribonuclease P protein component [Thiomicrospira sp. R3]
MSFDRLSANALPSKQLSPVLLRHDFPKSSRLLTPKQFQFVFAQAEKFANRHWTLIVRANDLPFSRLGLAVAKKQLSRAVWRNRVKRIAREGFRQHKDVLCGYDIVVLGRRGMQDIDNLTLANSFFHLVQKIALSDLKLTSVKE